MPTPLDTPAQTLQTQVDAPTVLSVDPAASDRGPKSGLLFRVAHFVGIDRAVAYTILARGWSACAGLVTVALIALRLTPAEQGYYVTFGSLVGLQIIFELGFSVVVLQLATHEVAHLTVDASGYVAGPDHHHSRLASIFRKALKWYTVAAVLMAGMLIPVGWRFFNSAPPTHPAVNWHWPWIAVVLASSLTFQIDPIFSFLEGCGFVARVARTRLTQSITGGLLAWSALLLHHGLFAPAMMIFGQALAGIAWIATCRRLLFHLFQHPIGQHAIDWWTEVWPFQWRIAISYACGFFIFQLFNPILLHYWGPVAAGRMGMSITLTNAIGTIAIAWITTKAAPFGAMIARREFASLDRIFFRAVAQTLALCVVGSTIVMAGNLFLNYKHLPFAQRILPPLPFAFLLIAMIINQAVNSMALYLRAHKQEKFLSLSIMGAIALTLSTYFLGRRFGAMGMASGQLAIAVVLGLGGGCYVFFKYRRLWHA